MWAGVLSSFPREVYYLSNGGRNPGPPVGLGDVASLQPPRHPFAELNPVDPDGSLARCVGLLSWSTHRASKSATTSAGPLGPFGNPTEVS